MKKSTILSVAFGLMGASALTAAVSYGLAQAPAPAVMEVAEVPFTLDPADGSTVKEDVTTMTITFPGASSVQIANGASLTADWNGTDVSANFQIRAIQPNQVMIAKIRTSLVDFSVDGTLTVTLEEGSVLVDGQSCQAITYTVHQGTGASSEFSWTADPADGSTVAALGEFTIYPAGLQYDNDEDAVTYYWNDVEYNGYEWYGYTDDSKGLIFRLKSGVSAPEGEGTLKVVFGEGFFVANGEPNPEFTYTLKQGASSGITWTLDPADGSTVEDVTTMTITFNGNVVITDNAAITADWNGTDVAQDFTIKSAGGNSVTIEKARTSMTDFSGEGTLNATLEAGSVLVDGEASPAISYTLHQGNVGPAPGETVEFMSLVDGGYPVPNSFAELEESMSMVGFMMSKNVTLNTACAEPAVLKLNTTEIATVSAASEEGDNSWATANGSMFMLTFSKAELMEDGVYTVEIPEGFLMTGDNYVGAAKVTYVKGLGNFTPAAGSVIDVADKAWSSLSLTPFSSVELYEIASESQSTFGTDVPMTLTLNGEVVESWPIEQQMIFRNKMSLSFKNKVTTPGEYTLNVPENYFMTTINKVTVGNPEMKYTFTVQGAAAPEMTYTLSPAAGEYKVYPTVMVTYDNFTGVTVNEGAKATLKVANNNYITFTISAEGSTVIFTPDAEFSQYIGNEYTQYHLMVPEGSYMLSVGGRSWPNEALDITAFRIAEPALEAPAFMSDPEDGAVVDSLSEIIVAPDFEFTRADTMKAGVLYPVTNGVRGTKVCSIFGKAASDKTYMIYTIPEASRNLADGDYEFVIPAKAFAFTVNGTPNIYSPEIVLHYHVGAPAREITWTLDPADGSTVEDVTTMTITFTDATEVAISDNAAIVADWNGTDVAQDFTIKYAGGTDVTIEKARTSMTDFTGEGTLNVTLEEGSVLVDGQKSPAISYTLYQAASVGPDPGETIDFMTLVEDGYPVANSFIDAEDVMSVVYFQMNQDVTVNTECEAPAVLKLNSNQIASISAASGEGDDSWATANGAMVELDFTKADLTEDGVYTVEIPEGFFKAGNNTVGAAKLTYIKGIGNFTPAAGSVIDVADKAWSSLSLAPFSGVELYEIASETESTFGTDEPMTLTLNGEVVESFPIEQQMIFRNKMSLSFKNKITEPGEYILNVPANYFMTTINKQSVGNGAMTYTFTVEGAAAPEMTYTLSPAAGEYKVYPTVMVTYDNFTGVTVNEGAKATLKVSNVNYITFTISAEGNTVIFTPDAEFSQYIGNEYTQYHLMVPEGSYMLSVGGRSWPNEALDITDYRIQAPVLEAPAFESDPEDGAVLESISEIVVAPEYAFTRSDTMKAGVLYPVTDGVRGAKVCSIFGKPAADKTYMLYTIPEASRDLEDGDYEFVIPAKAFTFTVNGTPNIYSPEMVFHFTIKTNDTGVAGIAADETVTVFTMTGVCLMRNADAEALNTLEKGMYIINGRKVLVK